MGNRVKRIRTEVSTTQMAQAITEGWKDLFNATCSKEQVALVLAQNALETGHRKNMWNYNIGNITTDGKGIYNFFDDLSTDEQIKPGVWKKMNLKYKAYSSLKEGVKDYLKFISSKKYANAWKHIVDPDPVAFSKALKQSGYYTANEKSYTKTITKLYNQYSKSNINNILSQPQIAQNDNSLINILDNYLQIVASIEKDNKKIYKKLLPINNILIKVNSTEYTNSIEFARVLCAALEEELMANSYTYTNGDAVEIECSIPGPLKDCINATQQLVNSMTDAFKFATAKIGAINIETKCVVNEKSSYKQIGFKSAEYQQRKFLLKFI